MTDLNAEAELVTEPLPEESADAVDETADTAPLFEPSAEPADEPSAEALQEEPESPEVDYASLMASDLAELKSEFPELSGICEITELENPLRYAALRDLGLTAAEAYLASSRSVKRRDSRAHLAGAAPGRASAPSSAYMSQKELAIARDIFSGMSDAEIIRLYRRVTQ